MLPLLLLQLLAPLPWQESYIAAHYVCCQFDARDFPFALGSWLAGWLLLAVCELGGKSSVSLSSLPTAASSAVLISRRVWVRGRR